MVGDLGAGAFVMLTMSVRKGCYAAWQGIVAVFHEPSFAVEVEVCAASDSVGNSRGQPIYSVSIADARPAVVLIHRDKRQPFSNSISLPSRQRRLTLGSAPRCPPRPAVPSFRSLTGPNPRYYEYYALIF